MDQREFLQASSHSPTALATHTAPLAPPQSPVARFEERRQCFLEQYREYTIKDAKGKVYHIDSDLTDGEDLADAGGLVQSYRAWEERLTNGKGEERKEEGEREDPDGKVGGRENGREA